MVLKNTTEKRLATKKPYKAPALRTDDVAAANLFCASGFVDCNDGNGCVPSGSC